MRLQSSIAQLGLLRGQIAITVTVEPDDFEFTPSLARRLVSPEQVCKGGSQTKAAPSAAASLGYEALAKEAARPIHSPATSSPSYSMN